MMNLGEGARFGKADRVTLQMTEKGGALPPPLPDSRAPAGESYLHLTANEDLSLEDASLITEVTTKMRASGEGDVDDLSWTADEDWKFDLVEGLVFDVPRPE